MVAIPELDWKHSGLHAGISLDCMKKHERKPVMTS